MTPILVQALPAAPALLLGAALIAWRLPGPRGRNARRAAQAATLAVLGLAAAAGAQAAAGGPGVARLIGWEGVGLSFRLDALSAVMFGVVAVVGAVVARFSSSYLEGDPRQGLFLARLCLTLSAVTALVLAGNLGQLVGAWIAVSLALHGLLVFRGERPKAVLAARKKFVTARLGDAFLIGAAILLFGAFGTGEIGALNAAAARAAEAGQVPSGAGWAALLIAVAALLKSAQFPFHGWLPEVMETPTPVSALLHAGIVNAGGFLVIRLADVMLLSAPALHLLAIIGGFTALFGALVMLVQPAAKGALAWSTVSQMGLMALQCGLGLFALATLHIAAHSLYKAHAFLAAGGAAEQLRAHGRPEPAAPGRAVGGLALALVLYAGIGWAAGLAAGAPVQAQALGVVLILGLGMLVAQAGGGARLRLRIAAGAAGVTLAYFALQAGARAWLSPLLPPAPEPDVVTWGVMALVVVSFAAAALAQLLAPLREGSARWRAARVHLCEGLYVNALFDRLMGGPPRPIAR